MDKDQSPSSNAQFAEAPASWNTLYITPEGFSCSTDPESGNRVKMSSRKRRLPWPFWPTKGAGQKAVRDAHQSAKIPVGALFTTVRCAVGKRMAKSGTATKSTANGARASNSNSNQFN